LATGQVTEEQARQLEEHVEKCARCAAALKAVLPRMDTLVEALRHETIEATPEASEIIRKFRSTPPRGIRPPEGLPISLTCSRCGKKLAVKPVLAGKKIKCPGCSTVLTAPSATEMPTVAPETRPAPAAIAAPALDDRGDHKSLSSADSRTDLPDDWPDQYAAVVLSHVDEDKSNLTEFLSKPTAPDELGRLGEYRILEILGHGGMGVVFKAEDPKLERFVAIKAMLPALAASARAGKRFLREARTMAKIEHDNIVRVYYVGEDRGVPFLAMEFLKGESLDKRLEREPVLPVDEVLRIGREMAEALGAAHEKELIHRDIKPGNVLLESPRGRVKLLDFGLARATSQDQALTQQGIVVGTPSYMAPEQARGGTVDGRCDLWSLGVAMYRMATGKQPFVGKDTVSTLMDVATREPDVPRKINAKVPPEVSALIMDLLQKDPAKRIATAPEVVERIRAIEARRGTRSPAAPSRAASETPAVLPRRRSWLLAAALGFFALLIVAGSVFYWQTASGIVRFEIDDDDIEVVLTKSLATVKKADKSHDITVAPATDHRIKITRGKDFEFETKEFVLKRGGTVTIKIEVVDGKVLAFADDRDIGSRAILAPGSEGRIAQAQQESQAKKLGEPIVITNSIGMKLALIPPGKFQMGSANADKEGRPQDGPAHHVTLTQPFRIGIYEATQAEYKAVMGKNPSDFAVKGKEQRRVFGMDTDRFPVDNVSWEDAVEFCRRLSEMPVEKGAGRVYRLPTEAEWEYACRAGTTTRFHTGAGLKPSEANFDKTQLSRTTTVGSYSPNAYGLFDMHGNLFEWCADWFADSYQGLPSEDPKGAAKGTMRAARGGNYGYSEYLCGSAARDKFVPGERRGGIGFRVVCEVRAKLGKTTPSTTPTYALSFTGEADRVSVPSLKPDPSRPLTVEGYVTQLAAAERNSFFYTYGGIYLNGGKTWSTSVSETKDLVTAASVIPVRLGKRTHVAGVYTGRRMLLFVDGELVVSQDYDGGSFRKPVFPSFAMGSEGDGSFCNGLIEEVRVSSSARYDKNFTPAARFEPDNDTLALYHMDEGEGDVLKDSSGNGHHGKIAGPKWVKADGTPIARLPEHQHWALRFDGSAKVDLPKLPLAIGTPFSLEAWVTPDADVLGKQASLIELRLTELRTNSTGAAWWFEMQDRSVSTVAKKGGLGPKRAVHVAGVFSGSELLLFVDGKLVDRSKTSGQSSTNAANAVLGDRWLGRIEEVRISKTARYEKDFLPQERFQPDADTLALYHCDEGAGDKLADSSGNGHHGKIVGAKWVHSDRTPIGSAPSAGNYLLRTDDSPGIGQNRERISLPTLKLPEQGPATLEAYFTLRQSKVDGFPQLFTCASQMKLQLGHDLRLNLVAVGKTAKGQKNFPTAASSKVPLLLGTKHHLAVVRTTDEFQVYVDGKRTATSVAVFAQEVPIYFGWVGGDFSELRVSRVARYTADFTPIPRFVPDADTLALYHCDEGKGQVLIDSSGSGHHGRIAGAKWLRADGTPIPPAEVEVFLDDFMETEVTRSGFLLGKQGWGHDGTPTSWRAKRPAHSLCLHPNRNSTFSVTYDLNGKYATFSATVGLADSVRPSGPASPLTFRVLGDDRELWKSPAIRDVKDEAPVHVSILGVQQLVLEVECPGGNDKAHALWIEPRLTPAP
jgi:formylglycine-generating enzyme required for sulfatase activity